MSSRKLSKLISLGGRSAASIADQAATSAVSFVAAMFIGRTIGAEALGIYAMTNAVVVVVRGIQNGVVLEPMSVFGPQTPDDRKCMYFGFLVILQVFWVFGTTLVAALAFAVLYTFGTIGWPFLSAVLAALASSNLLCLQDFMRRQFYVEHRQNMAMVQSVLFLMLALGGIVLLWNLDASTVADVYVVFAVCSILVCVLWGGGHFWEMIGRPSGAQIRAHAREHWEYGRWILLGIPVGIITNHGLFWIVGALLSAEDAGYLKAAESLIAPFAQVLMGLSLMLVPMAAIRVRTFSHAEQKAFAFKIGAPLLALAIVYSAILFLFGDDLLLALFGKTAQGAYPLIGIMALAPMVGALPLPAAIMTSALRRPKFRFYSHGLAAISVIFVGLPLMLSLSLPGAAIAYVLASAVHAIGQWAFLIWLWRHPPHVPEAAPLSTEAA